MEKVDPERRNLSAILCRIDNSFFFPFFYFPACIESLKAWQDGILLRYPLKSHCRSCSHLYDIYIYIGFIFFLTFSFNLQLTCLLGMSFLNS